MTPEAGDNFSPLGERFDEASVTSETAGRTANFSRAKFYTAERWPALHQVGARILKRGPESRIRAQSSNAPTRALARILGEDIG